MGSTAKHEQSSTVRNRHRKLVINDAPIQYEDKFNSEVENEEDQTMSSTPEKALVKVDTSTSENDEPSPSTSKAHFSKRLHLYLGNEQLSIQQAPQQQQPLLTEKNQQTTPSYADDDPTIPKPRKLGIMEFVGIELTRGYSLHQEQERYTEKRRKVYAFVRIPYELEKFLFHGFLQCLDSFCHIFTFLPIRIMLGLLGCLTRKRAWSSADTCDVLKVFIIVAASWFMHFIDTSALYHLVRGQGVIKLYIFYNMLEVLDKLLSSFGQDILDALLWTASERESRRKLLMTMVHLLFAISYAFGHAILVLLQATTLNVAFFNMHNNSLLTIMMSNNFVELKGSVFKKFAKPNLFQMSCSDVRERFHTVVLLIVVVMRIMTAVNWDLEHLTVMIPDLATVIIAEYIVDWLKHAFITKFNEMSPEVYQDFTITLAFDVVRTHEKTSFSDFCDQVSRRMGFIPIPISIMLIRVISQSVDLRANSTALLLELVCEFIVVAKYIQFQSKYLKRFLTATMCTGNTIMRFHYCILKNFILNLITSNCLVWFGLLTIKIVTGIFLHSRAVDQVNYYRDLQEQAKNDVYRRRIICQKSRSVPGSPRLSLIDFTDVLTQATSAPKTMTMSDMLTRTERRREPSETKTVDVPNVVVGELPRRCQSMVDFRKSSSSIEERRGKSSQPTSIPEGEERTPDDCHSPTTNNSADVTQPKVATSIPAPFRRENSLRKQMSPQRKLQSMEYESLSKVQAYTLLTDAEQAEQFRS